MSRASRKATAESVPDDATVPLTDPSTQAEKQTYAKALRLTGAGASALAKGSGGIGFLLARHAFALARKGVSKARASSSDLAQIAAIDRSAVADTPKVSRPRARLVVAATVAAALAGGAVLFRQSRRKLPPPVADAPPTLRPVANGSPVSNGSSAPKHALIEPNGPATAE